MSKTDNGMTEAEREMEESMQQLREAFQLVYEQQEPQLAKMATLKALSPTQAAFYRRLTKRLQHYNYRRRRAALYRGRDDGPEKRDSRLLESMRGMKEEAEEYRAALKFAQEVVASLTALEASLTQQLEQWRQLENMYQKFMIDE